MNDATASALLDLVQLIEEMLDSPEKDFRDHLGLVRERIMAARSGAQG